MGMHYGRPESDGAFKGLFGHFTTAEVLAILPVNVEAQKFSLRHTFSSLASDKKLVPLVDAAGHFAALHSCQKGLRYALSCQYFRLQSGRVDKIRKLSSVCDW